MKRYFMILLIISTMLMGLKEVAVAGGCDELIKQGLYNISLKRSGEASLITKVNEYCGKNYEDLSDSVKASVDVDIIGIGGGSGAVDVANKKTRLNDWCSKNQEYAKKGNDIYEEVKSIYQGSLDAWSKCKELEGKDIQIEPQIAPNAQTVDISLRYTGAAPNGIAYMGLIEKGFKCTQEQVDATGIRRPIKTGEAARLTNQAIKVHCDRDKPKTEIRKTTADTEYSHQEAGYITVRTADKKDLQLNFEESWQPNLPEQEAAQIKAQMATLLPIGAVVPFYLTPAEIVKLAPNWQPADGRTINDPKSPLNGKSLPNLKNKFVYGLDSKKDVVVVNNDTEGGSNEVEVSLPYSGEATNTSYVDKHIGFVDRVQHESDRFFTIDTEVREASYADHKHKYSGNTTKTKVPLPLPPYRGLIYMVRVR